jgi:hypothetical protein
MAVLVLVFLGLGLALIGIDRRMGRSNGKLPARQPDGSNGSRR